MLYQQRIKSCTGSGNGPYRSSSALSLLLPQVLLLCTIVPSLGLVGAWSCCSRQNSMYRGISSHSRSILHSSTESAIENNGLEHVRVEVVSIPSSEPFLSLDTNTTEMVKALADLRYNEWIRDQYPDVSRLSFQEATMDMFQERVVQGGATIVLARTLPELDVTTSKVVCPDVTYVGAAELSPIEIRGALLVNNSDTIFRYDADDQRRESNEHFHTYFGRFVYVTDLVTCQMFRRQGVALKLMEHVHDCAMQNTSPPSPPGDRLSRRRGLGHALPPSTATILLHVDPANQAALNFYQSDKLGYSIVGDNRKGTSRDQRDGRNAKETSDMDIRTAVDIARLAQNAGVTNQLLLFKVLRTESSSGRRRYDSGRGFVQRKRKQ